LQALLWLGYAARMREHLVWARLPSAVPVTNAALYARYQPVLQRLVRRQVKYGISHVDAEGEVWLRLFHARVIDRYVLNRLVFDPVFRRRYSVGICSRPRAIT
jgi:hypothetical protein